MNSKIGFWLRRAAAVFEAAYIAQLIQVALSFPHKRAVVLFCEYLQQCRLGSRAKKKAKSS